MRISEKISVNTNYTRSTNLNRDTDSQALVESYIPTSRAIRTIEQITDALGNDEAPKAWSLIGPYGSGKSTFAAFLANAIGAPSDERTKAAYSVLGKSSAKAEKAVRKIAKGTEGYCTVLLTGSPASLATRLLNALYESLEPIWSQRRGKNPKFLDDISTDLLIEHEVTVDELFDYIKKAQDALSRIGYVGLLIVIDELGKFLEYETRHSDSDQIYLLQMLAEHAYAEHTTKLALILTMHQSIDQYARGLGEDQRNEWTKVQGRFENIPFIETPEQTLKIVGAAINQSLSDKERTDLNGKVSKLTASIVKENVASPTIKEEELKALFAECYPLHPVSALLLPILCQKVAQNERTLFSYLGSKEEQGFLDSLQEIEKIGGWIYPWEIFEYFIRNQPASVHDHYTHRRWAEVMTALDRVGNADESTVHMLKTIGLLNIIGAQGGLKASKALLDMCLPTKTKAKSALTELRKQSVIQYRKFNAEYRVWQGSDFDLEERIQEELEKIGHFSVAEMLNDRHEMLPIVARKYSMQSGTLRYFTPLFIDRDTATLATQSASEPQIIFYLSESGDDDHVFYDEVVYQSSEENLFVLVSGAKQLRSVLAEVIALEQVENTSQELGADPVAHHEFQDVYIEALKREEELLSSILRRSEMNQWYWKSEPVDVGSRRAVQALMSDVLNEIYHASPVIKNELINRDKTSAQANTARNKLVRALIEHGREEDLGVEKFPAEKSIYRSVLRQSGLHRVDRDGQWHLMKLSDLRGVKDVCNIKPIWRRIDRFLNSCNNNHRSLVELNKELFAPPYGVKEGVLALLYCSAILAYEDELEIIEDGSYVPKMSFEHFERFLKRPDTFAVRKVSLSGVNGNLLEAYSIALFADGAENTRSLLEVAKPIAQFFDELPQYTLKTEQLSEAADKLREAYKVSKSPIRMLLEAFPSALSIISGDQPSKIASHFISVIKEIKHAHQNMVETLLRELGEMISEKGTSIKSIRKALSSYSYGLDNYSMDERGVKGFVTRIQRDQVSDDEWVESLLLFLGGKPSKSWNDSIYTAAKYKQAALVSKMRDLKGLQVADQGFSCKDEERDIYMLKVLKSNKENSNERDEVVIIDAEVKASAIQLKGNLSKVLSNGEFDDRTKLAAIAELVNELFEAKEVSVQEGQQKDFTPKVMEGGARS